jgi:hypothetical protein
MCCSLQLGMKTDGNGQQNPSTISVPIFYYGKREWERNSQERERNEIYGLRKRVLLLNHRSPLMNITLHTILRKLFLKNMIKVHVPCD